MSEVKLLPISWADFWMRQGHADAAHNHHAFEMAQQWLQANLAEREREVERLRLRLHRIETGLTEQIEFHVEQVEEAEARAERLAEALREASHAGALLANIAYNLAQDESLSEPVRWSLDDARKRWDQAATTANAALEQETTNGQ